MTTWQAERAQLLQHIADLELRAVTAESRADWLRSRACLAVGIRPDEHDGDQALLARLEQMHETASP